MTLNGKKSPGLIADWETLQRIFIRPEDEACRQTLVKYMEQILFGLHDFLNSNVGVTEPISLKELTREFQDTLISPNPEKKLESVISDIINQIAPRAVNVASPYFVGHMTSAIPFFMVHLKAIVAALNQNVIKLETSKVLSVLEKQVLAKIHRLIFNRSEAFYQTHVQSVDTSLGAFTTGGTTANITAMWLARNRFFDAIPGDKGVEEHGMVAAMQARGLERAVILVSKRGHFSLKKAGGILGIGNGNVLPMDVDPEHRVDLKKLEATIRELKADGKTGIIALVGIAGTTETGTVDPLVELADLCREHDIHFHVDAAWGGPVLLSERHAHLLKGIERADSVTMDGHKQFYMPMTCGMVYFRDPKAMDLVAYHSNYVNRQGSVDLGIKSLEGSREANALILDSSLKIMGSRGYALMIDHGIETAKLFAAEIERREGFQIITRPELNILTYRVVPPALGARLETADLKERAAVTDHLDRLNTHVQRTQREAGKSFVSRTRLNLGPLDKKGVVVLRSVIMNPMTTIKILNEILDEQEEIAAGFDKVCPVVE
ncbi:MAG: putative pyridoxal-dependent aspartate 1-decarboxylase [Desulfobacteraceae bacterium]|nr:putative pyridoxal-dependent aspartate 1-decarboxylase [Desulfobacteraceae bacterium]